MGLESQKFNKDINKPKYSLLPEEEAEIRAKAKQEGVDEEWAVAAAKNKIKKANEGIIEKETDQIARDYLKKISAGGK